MNNSNASQTGRLTQAAFICLILHIRTHFKVYIRGKNECQMRKKAGLVNKTSAAKGRLKERLKPPGINFG
jgi:hypothetical protein